MKTNVNIFLGIYRGKIISSTSSGHKKGLIVFIKYEDNINDQYG